MLKPFREKRAYYLQTRQLTARVGSQGGSQTIFWWKDPHGGPTFPAVTRSLAWDTASPTGGGCLSLPWSTCCLAWHASWISCARYMGTASSRGGSKLRGPYFVTSSNSHPADPRTLKANREHLPASVAAPRPLQTVC